MRLYSTNNRHAVVGLRQAALNGLAPDGGLYMPTTLPRLPADFFARMDGASFQAVAAAVGNLFFEDDVPADRLDAIVREACNFTVPLARLDHNLYALELFRGPTCAFKDFGARFTAQLFGYFLEKSREQVTILAATSGDTGSAVAHAFLNIPGSTVVILYPSGKISTLQEKQLTTMGGNVTALEIQGSFDDCQHLVKQAFQDRDLRRSMTLASANSINIARLLPQVFYYVYLCAQLQRVGKPIVVSVPSGNFGNLTAGLIAKRMGAPIAKFVAATNANNVIPEYLRTGIFSPKASVCTISNAMDVGNPSNFARMLELYDGTQAMQHDVYGVSFADSQTNQALVDVLRRYNYMMDPHGAIAYLGLEDYRKQSDDFVGVFLETAHPAKFLEVIAQATGEVPVLPQRLKAYLDGSKKAVTIENDFNKLKAWIKQNRSTPWQNNY